MRVVLVALGLVATGFAQDQGLKPRGSASDYPSEAAGAEYSIGAAVLPPEMVKKLFASELNRGWIVVEVALYPKAGQQIEVDMRDFTLRTADGKATARAARPSAVAGSLQKNGGKDRDVTVVATETVGYESGSYNDPATGQWRRSSGWYTGTGVGVGVDPNPRASTGRDRDVLDQELADQMLPSGPTSKPVAGYLYFPMPDKKRTTALDLEHETAAGRVEMPLVSKK